MRSGVGALGVGRGELIFFPELTIRDISIAISFGKKERGCAYIDYRGRDADHQ